MGSTLRILSALAAMLYGAMAAADVDVSASKDHPLFSRYPGSLIREYKQKEFDEFDLPVKADPRTPTSPP